MKRTLVLLTAAAVAVTPVLAEAATKPKPKPTTRTVTWDYQGPGGAHVSTATMSVCSPTTCFDLATEKYEKLVSLTSVDKSGQPVGFMVSVDKVTGPTFCGKGDIAVGKSEVVSVVPALTADCPAVPTQGTVTFVVTGSK
jgi:hypothetical protein